jgi:hypothetical protein
MAIDQYFRTEKALVDTLKPFVTTLLSTSRRTSPSTLTSWVFEQVSVGMTIPDLVIVKHSAQRTGNSHSRRTLSHFESAALAELYFRGRQRLESLSMHLFAQEHKVLATLLRLEKIGAVCCTNNGEIRLRPGVIPPRAKTIAIEAKLRNWKEALLQAKTYLGFANYSYVALPTELIERTPEIAECCSKEGIGLISAEPDNHKIVQEAKLHECLNSDWIWLLVKTVGLLIKPYSATKRDLLEQIAQAPVASLPDGSELCAD